MYKCRHEFYTGCIFLKKNSKDSNNEVCYILEKHRGSGAWKLFIKRLRRRREDTKGGKYTLYALPYGGPANWTKISRCVQFHLLECRLHRS